MEIDCPSDCAFLDGAHAGAWEGRSADRDRDARRIGPFLEGLSEAQGRLVLLSLVGVTAIRARRRDLDDRLLLEAVQALRMTVETREKGILYEHPAADARAQGLVHELAGLFEATGRAGPLPRARDRDLAAALSRLERAVAGHPRRGGVRPRLPRHRRPPRRPAGPAPGGPAPARPHRGALSA